MLKDGEYIGHEVYFPNKDVPQETIDLLIRYGFCESNDGFYIPKEALEMFKKLAFPYEVRIMQYGIILGGGNFEEQMDQLLDTIIALKAAGVQGIENFINKIRKISQNE